MRIDMLNISIGGYLLFAAISDIKTRQLSRNVILLCAALFLPFAIVGLYDKELQPMQHILGAAFGGIFLGIGYATKEALGYADGWSIVLIGLYLGLRPAMFIACCALFLAALQSMLLLGVKKAKKSSTFPFLPFLFAAFLLWNVCATYSGTDTTGILPP